MKEPEGGIEVKEADKRITLKVWRGRGKKLKVKYKDFKELEEDANKKIKSEYYYITTVPKLKLIMIYPFSIIEYGKDDERVHLSRDCLFYFATEKNEYKKMNTEKFINKLVDKLVPHVSVEELVRDALYDTNPEDLREMYERVIEKKGSVRDKPGCYKLMLGGKKGAPFEFMLRE